MNKQSCLAPSTGLVASPVASPVETYSYRIEDCPDCDRATDIRCDTCWSSGEVEAACCECCNVAPLDDDGYCRSCMEPTGWALAERCAIGMAR